MNWFALYLMLQMGLPSGSAGIDWPDTARFTVPSNTIETAVSLKWVAFDGHLEVGTSIQPWATPTEFVLLGYEAFVDAKYGPFTIGMKNRGMATAGLSAAANATEFYVRGEWKLF